MPFLPRRALSATAVAAISASSFLAFGLSPASAATGTKTFQPAGTANVVDLININDFHGRIDTNYTGAVGLSVACTVESTKTKYGSTLLSAGDNIGASPFTSMSQQDNPTIDYLNALELKASAVGNHEFDKGFDDLQTRVKPRANWDYLAANVIETATSQPIGDAYKVLDINGVRVAVIGAVTQETPALTGPNSTGMLTFTDPVQAVNTTAANIKAAGIADVIVAEYHEGAAANDPSTAPTAIFTKIVNQTSADVSAIFTAHTHMAYVLNAPMPNGDGTRPVIQSASYGTLLGHVQLTVDPATKKVTSYAAENITIPSSPATDCPTDDPQYVAAAAVVNSAVAQAKAIGQQNVGSVTADITTAYADGKRDDRGSESTLSNLIAQSMVDVLNEPGRSGAQIGLMNPGGVRAELLKDDGTNTTGDITYGEAAAVTPFANTLQTIEVTGAVFKQVLEQQWQPAGSSRTFLKLGLSKNVTYTYDPDRAAGDRITSITVDGKPIDPAATYTVVGASFLIAGGDNFTALEQGTGIKDSGLIDTESFVDWIRASSPLSPSFAKGAVIVRGLPTGVQAGGALSFQAEGFDMTSLGSPTNTGGKVMLDGAEIGTFTIATPGASAKAAAVAASGPVATIDTVIPASTTEGAHTLQLVADPSGTTVTIPLDVTAAPVAATPTVTVNSPVTAGGETDVTISGFAPNTQVDILVDGVVIAQVTTDADGGYAGMLQVPTTAIGEHTLTVQAGDQTASATFQVIAAETTPETTAPTDAPGTPGATGTTASTATVAVTGRNGKPKSGALAATGTDAVPQLALAGVLLGAGATCALAGRRRKA